MTEPQSQHHLYDKIVQAVKEGVLDEPFCCDDVTGTCTGVDGFSQGYIEDHLIGNKKGNVELFEEVGPDRYRCARPSDYSPI